jgi:hypothetical protein
MRGTLTEAAITPIFEREDVVVGVMSHGQYFKLTDPGLLPVARPDDAWG